MLKISTLIVYLALVVYLAPESSQCLEYLGCITLPTGETDGSKALLTCGPNKSDEPEYVNKCKEKDETTHCFCDTELCNQLKESSAVQFVSNWIFITLGLFALLQI